MIKNSIFMRCLILFYCAAAVFSANASNNKKSIQVRQECGFSYAECGPPLINLIQDGAAVNYEVDAKGQPIFSLAYIGNEFVMTALQPNTIASESPLPYGLDIYWGGGPLIQKWDCFPADDPSCQGGTAIHFMAWMEFPTDPALPLTVQIPAVPEPGTGVLTLFGFGVAACWVGCASGKTNLL